MSLSLDMAVIECLVYSKVWNGCNSFLCLVVQICLMDREIWRGTDNGIAVFEIVVYIARLCL